MKFIETLQKREWPSWMPELLAALGAFLYLIQAILYAHTTIPGLDEGSYLFKGWLFLRGIYEPFQPYGPLTNKAPFAFLIPGFAQVSFGPGLRTGRYFAILLGLLAVFGAWLTARRWAGRWVAAAVVWAFALSPMIIKIHAITASEVIIACMLAWMCVFVVAEQRSGWQIILGSVLAALAVLTRQNMILVLPLLVLYVFWQHGKQKGIWALAVVTVIFISVHLYYWPNILTIWAPWLPDGLTPFLDPFRLPEDAVPVWDPSIDFWNRLISFFQGVRYHFVAVIGGVLALFAWPRLKEWKSPAAFRAAVFLAVLYFILFGMHAWAALASQYESYSCVFCFTPYLTFFDPLGVLLAVIVFAASAEGSSRSLVQRTLLNLLVLVFATGIGFSLFEAISPEILTLPVPRVRDGQFLPGSTQLVDLLANKFDLSMAWIKRSISASLGLLAGMILLAALLMIWRRTKRLENGTSYGRLLVHSVLLAGLLISPMLNQGSAHIDCNEDVILANEQLGSHLARIIPPGSLVYWEGGLSFTPMVYLPDVRIFPPQINDGYTYRTGGDPDTLYRFGHWNAELNQTWIDSADIFIIESWRYPPWKDFLNPDEFEEYQKPSAAPSCAEGGELRIFHRLP